MTAIDFYRGAVLPGGLSYDVAIGFTDDRLEVHHSYIQWLFPTDQLSNFNPNAPLLTKEQAEEFKSDVNLQIKMLVAFNRMLRFYGFRFEGDNCIVPIKELNPDTAHWLCFGDHNYLRMSRIMRSLTLCGMNIFAKMFYEALANLYSKFPGYISENNMRYWKLAIVTD